MEADITALIDRQESRSLMEPMLLRQGSPGSAVLGDKALLLAQESAALRASMHPRLVSALADLVRAMNCYYSNLIEGSDTHPIQIERAMAKDYSQEPAKRDLQLEAVAHIQVQAWIDAGGLAGRETTVEGLCEIHRRFCEALPPALLRARDAKTGKELPVVPGQLRRQDVIVGQHVPVSPGALPDFMARFEAVYSPLGKLDRVLAAASAHHRLLWIHPFLDGNGRVTRLMSHATLLEALDTGCLWSVARGLARQVREYKTHLAACDQQRRNDLDGRGHLSEEAQLAFTGFFLDICLDQVRFMRSLMEPSRLHERIRRWAQQAGDAAGSSGALAAKVMEAVLYRGVVPRSEVPLLLDVSDRHARRVTGWLESRGALTSVGAREPWTLAFPASLAGDWMPGLFPPIRPDSPP